jgi:hypothetical protein
MNEELEQLLKDYVATANNPKYGGDWAVVNSKFPELKDYDDQLLKDYVATANNKEYKSDWGVINSKFPELDLKKKEETSEVSPEPVVVSGEELLQQSEEPSSDPQSTLGTDPVKAQTRADVPEPTRQPATDTQEEYVKSGDWFKGTIRQAGLNKEREEKQFEEERLLRTDKANSMASRMFAFDWLDEDKTSRKLTKEELKVADDILSLSNIKNRYLEEEDGPRKIGRGEEYVNDLMQRIPRESLKKEELQSHSMLYMTKSIQNLRRLKVESM